MTRTLKKRNKSITSSWIFSYALIVIISLVFFFVAYITSGKIISEQTQQFNEQVFDTTSKNTVGVLNSMRKISYELSDDDAINILLSETDYNKYYSDRTINEFRRSVEDLVQYNDAIDFAYFYIPHTDCVVSDRGVFDAKTFYNTYINKEDYEYTAWENAYADNTKEYFMRKLACENGENGENGENYVSFNVRVSANVTGEEKTGYVCVIASEDEFFGTKWADSHINSGDIYIYDNDGQLLVSRNISQNTPPQEVSELKNIEKGRVIISDAVSIDSINMYIAMAVPEKYVTQKERLLDWFFIIYLILQILIVVPIILKAVKVNYTPIREILNIFNIKNPEDEYKQLHQCIKNIVHEKQTLEKENKRQYDTLKQNQLSKLLMAPTAKLNDILNGLDISFDYGRFAVIGLDIDDPNRLFDTYDDMTDDERYAYLKLIISNVFEEALTTECSVAYVTEAENMIVCIVNFDGDESIIEKKTVFASDFVYTNFGIKISHLLSGIHENADELYSAYHEMLSVLEYKLLFELDGDFTYDTTNELCGVQYGFGYDMEQRLLVSVKNGSYNEAEKTILQIFSNIKAERNVSYKYIKILMFDIIAALLKITDALDLDRNEVMSGFELREEKFRSANLDELQDNILQYVQNICSYVTSESIRDQTEIVEQIELYIERNYSDTSLSIASIGEAFGMTGSYLSKKFKAVKGELLVNYISKYRIDVAKRLMRETNYNRDTIAKMVGVGHPRTFNRLFKKYEGITPTEYKEKIGKIRQFQE